MSLRRMTTFTTCGSSGMGTHSFCSQTPRWWGLITPQNLRNSPAMLLATFADGAQERHGNSGSFLYVVGVTQCQVVLLAHDSVLGRGGKNDNRFGSVLPQLSLSLRGYLLRLLNLSAAYLAFDQPHLWVGNWRLWWSYADWRYLLKVPDVVTAHSVFSSPAQAARTGISCGKSKKWINRGREIRCRDS